MFDISEIRKFLAFGSWRPYFVFLKRHEFLKNFQTFLPFCSCMTSVSLIRQGNVETPPPLPPAALRSCFRIPAWRGLTSPFRLHFATEHWSFWLRVMKSGLVLVSRVFESTSGLLDQHWRCQHGCDTLRIGSSCRRRAAWRSAGRTPSPRRWRRTGAPDGGSRPASASGATGVRGE